MNKELKFTVAAGASVAFTYPVGISRLAVTNYNGTEGGSGESANVSKTIENAAIAHFTDAAEAPLIDLAVDIVATQSGTGAPAPDNVRTIVGFDTVKVAKFAKNLLTNGMTLANRIHNLFANSSIDTANKTVTFAPSNSEGYPSILYNGKQGSEQIPFEFEYPYKENTQYTFIIKATTTAVTNFNAGVSYTDGTNNGGLNTQMLQNGYIVFTSPKNKTIRSLYVGNYSGATKFWYEEMGVFEGVVSLADADFTSRKNYAFTMPASEGYVYDALFDVLPGKLIIGHKLETYVGAESEEWTYSDGSFIIAKPDNSARLDGCNLFDPHGSSETNNSIRFESSDIVIKTDVATTVEDWKTYLAAHNLQVLYLLTTPVEYDMQPNEIYALSGENNIFTNCGEIVKVTYITSEYAPLTDLIDDKTPVFFDAVVDYSTSTISLVGATSTDINNYLLSHKNANIIIRLKGYSTITLCRLMSYSPNYNADFISQGIVFIDEGTKKIRFDTLRLDLTQETSDFEDAFIIVSGT